MSRMAQIVRNYVMSFFDFEDMYEKFSSAEFLKQVAWTTVSIILALVTGAFIMSSSGYDPGAAYIGLLGGAILQFDITLFYTTSFILAGLSVALAFRCGLFNIGAEGQLLLGSIAATYIGYTVALPIFIHPLVCLIVAAIIGSLYGFLPGLLKAYRGAHEVVTTMMLSYIAVELTHWLAAGPWHNPGDPRTVTPEIFVSAELPKLFGSSHLNLGLLLAILCVIAVDFFINHTTMGYEMRAVGHNETAAETAGIDAKKNMALALGISGGLAGLAGGHEILGFHHRFYSGWSAGLGFDGITVAVLGRNNPWGVFFGSLFFGALKAGGGRMSTVAGVPAEMVVVIQGLVVLYVAAPKIIEWAAKQGYMQGKWIMEKPNQALPVTSGMIIGFVSFAIGLALGAAYLSLNPVLAVGFILVSLTGAVCGGRLLSRDKQGVQYLMITGILWITLGVLDIISGIFMISVVALIFGIFSILIAYISRDTLNEEVSIPISQEVTS